MRITCIAWPLAKWMWNLKSQQSARTLPNHGNPEPRPNAETSGVPSEVEDGDFNSQIQTGLHFEKSRLRFNALATYQRCRQNHTDSRNSTDVMARLHVFRTSMGLLTRARVDNVKYGTLITHRCLNVAYRSVAKQVSVRRSELK